MKRSEESPCELWDTIKKNYILVEYQKKKRERGRIVLKNNALNFPNLGKDLDIQIHKVHKTPRNSTQKYLLQDKL